MFGIVELLRCSGMRGPLYLPADLPLPLCLQSRLRSDFLRVCLPVPSGLMFAFIISEDDDRGPLCLFLYTFGGPPSCHHQIIVFELCDILLEQWTFLLLLLFLRTFLRISSGGHVLSPLLCFLKATSVYSAICTLIPLISSIV
ncbi:hypothetical protein NPIL_2551 [Nephila pilipes]|uniref:Uncharacterized protein n=1 Tax=Nephila pilipes TaxID=299642 RepID=A0A8X6QYG6_NEPPI|nr:hypothetical protein NPIL_2551 [Nephila pilipes]